MSWMKQRALVVLLPLLLLVGCGSSPKTHFHTLVPEPPAQGASPMPGTGLPIQIGDVNLPGTLDRQSLVTRGPGTTLNVSDQDRWAAPLDELIRRALTSDLRDRLGVERVLAPGDARPPGGVLVVALNIQRFSGDSAGDVVLDTDWTIGKTTPDGALQTHHALLRVKAASGSPDAITAAMSQALGQLADEIAARTAGGGTRG
jgi:uncharacterized lipoprotein YmbA